MGFWPGKPFKEILAFVELLGSTCMGLVNFYIGFWKTFFFSYINNPIILQNSTINEVF